MKFLVGAVVGIVATVILGPSQSPHPPSDGTQSSTTANTQAPRVEIHEKVVRKGVSEDCKEEIKWTLKVAATTRELGKAYNPQEGIIDRSFQGIISKDWQLLNDEKQNQINLSNKADVLRIRLVEEMDRYNRVKGSC